MGTDTMEREESRTAKFSVQLPTDVIKVVDLVAKHRYTSRAAVIREWVAERARNEEVA